MYREVTMIELQEILRLRREHLPKKLTATQFALDPKTVGRCLRAAKIPEPKRAISATSIS